MAELQGHNEGFGGLLQGGFWWRIFVIRESKPIPGSPADQARAKTVDASTPTSNPY
jgi:hypothetical protein